MMATRERLVPILEAALRPSPYLLEDVVVTPAGRRSVVRVVVDRVLETSSDEDVTTEPSQPLSLDDVAEATHVVSTALDAGDVMGESAYTLEVTSPGVSRPLTLPRHFRRNVGRLVTVFGPEPSVTGRLTSVGPQNVVLEVAPTKKTQGGPVSLRLADISRGEVQIEFNRPDAIETDEEH